MDDGRDRRDDRRDVAEAGPAGDLQKAAATSAVSEGLSLRDRIEVYLLSAPDRAFCDTCLARRLALPVKDITVAAETIGRMPNFQRAKGRCSPCRSTKRIVTRAVRQNSN